MNLEITNDAAKWFIDEMGLEKGDYVQFFLKIYGGIKTEHPNYFLGLTVGRDGEVGVKQEVEGITFYFSEKDAWFLEEYDMKVVMGKDEVEYQFREK
ncbi:HesB/YadR/YfhF family protein [Ornithinibacillus xuwenensis]|uniref:HesB/YadR/YfhF family protein n=1 Tax=Ornithinibacillus xuwenensis TaxID=3144668 RepID=A0ABU9XL83_9BACI